MLCLCSQRINGNTVLIAVFYDTPKPGNVRVTAYPVALRVFARHFDIVEWVHRGSWDRPATSATKQANLWIENLR